MIFDSQSLTTQTKTLILGVGNIFRGDDGVGPNVIKLLKDKYLTSLKNSDLLDGGIDGLALLDVIPEYSDVIIIDAVRMDMSPGTVKVFTPSEAEILIHSDSLSTHGFGLAEIIALMRTLKIETRVQIIGVQPQDIEFGENLSSVVYSKLESLAHLIIEMVSAFPS